MEIYKVSPGKSIDLGRQGENLARQVRFDLSGWISSFGPGTVQLLHERKDDKAPYPVAVEQDGNLAVWTVTSADTSAAGNGRAELQYYVGNALVKTETWATKVRAALGPVSETPPEAQQGWVDQVLQAGAAAAEAAEKAENAALRQPYPNAETGTWWVWDAESGAYTDTGISYGTGAGGGVTDHDKLLGRDKVDQHPMGAITGLADALDAVSIGSVPVPAVAEVGQVLSVKAVNAAGQPTEWEAVDMASGSGKWETIIDTTLEEDSAINTGEMPGKTEVLCIFAAPISSANTTLTNTSKVFGSSIFGLSISSAAYGKIGFIHGIKMNNTAIPFAGSSDTTSAEPNFNTSPKTSIYPTLFRTADVSNDIPLYISSAFPAGTKIRVYVR